MVVAPPCIYPSGVQYAFLDALADIGEFARLLFGLTPHPQAAAPGAEVDRESLDALMAAQSPKLRAHWRLLKVPHGEFDRSRADFAVARGARVLLSNSFSSMSIPFPLPGFRAQKAPGSRRALG